ncbi:phosphotransferase enzyme family protein [Nonomuraea basaltis]|uniref:phosphotransferase enzyme family protein n=1 Tax=Nonomuraea basaltis TaxID=2495887 RepID=UPI00110C6C17|nr:aminoglycoside phosphotransferase family protein [Nonomuraea basaltis]TMR93447.1 aminoglycoside phosphotransferase family protein [Nonomuraea basaltis]
MGERPSGELMRAVARAYGLGEPLGPPVYAARGELGRIWRLDTDGGSWAVKELLAPAEESGARADTAFQLAAGDAGVRLPRPVTTAAGDVLLDGRWRLYEWVDLVPGEVVTGAELGAVTAELHRVGHPASGPVIPWFSEPVGRGGWEALPAAGGAWAPALERALPGLIALDALVVPPDPGSVTTCHCDVNVENVRRAADGGVIVLDWENCGPARPAWELAKILADLSLDDAAAAYRAYRAAGGVATVSEPADFSMAIVEQGHLLEFYARRALSPEESDENRARARRRMSTMLGRPLTPARIDALLTAL